MHPALKNDYHQLALLDDFLARYRVPAGFVLCTHVHPAGLKPALSFDADKKEWALKTFGADGWSTDGKHESKEFVDVRVCLHGSVVEATYPAHYEHPATKPENLVPALLAAATAK